jgi:hypothetical protein
MTSDSRTSKAEWRKLPRSLVCLAKARLAITSARTVRPAGHAWPWMKSSCSGIPVRRSANAPEVAHAFSRFSAGSNPDISCILFQILQLKASQATYLPHLRPYLADPGPARGTSADSDRRPDFPRDSLNASCLSPVRAEWRRVPLLPLTERR